MACGDLAAGGAAARTEAAAMRARGPGAASIGAGGGARRPVRGVDAEARRARRGCRQRRQGRAQGWENAAGMRRRRRGGQQGWRGDGVEVAEHEDGDDDEEEG